jgi:hypothetical protein
MTMPTPRIHTSHLLGCVLILIAACNGEPYELEGPNPSGVLPDQDLEALEADRAYQGEPMHEGDPNEPEYKLSDCTAEDKEAFRKSATRSDGFVQDEALIGCRPPAKPGAKNAPGTPATTSR